MHASTSSLTVALVASATLLASQVEGESPSVHHPSRTKADPNRTHTALPMTRSSSSVARRAHIATHHHHNARAADLQLGDHAIVVDASSSGNTQSGGIKNSTINLTSISHQNKRSDSTFSGFSRVVRSLFGVSTTRRRSSEEAALPLTFAPSSSAATAAAAATPSASKIAAVNPKGVKRTKRSHAFSSKSKKGRRSRRPRNFGKHPRPAPINLKKRAAPIENPSQSTLVVPVAARYITRQVKRGGGGATYSEALAQASIYSAAIAALPESTPTASAVVASEAAPTVAAYIASPQNNRNNSGSPYSGSPLMNAPDGSYGNAAAARARGFSSSTLSWASIAAASSTTSKPVPTSTTTTPLVSVDSNGITWVQAATAAFATPAPLSTSSSSTVINPKAALAVSSSSAAPSVQEATATSPSSSTSALPTSPPPSTATLRR